MRYFVIYAIVILTGCSSYSLRSDERNMVLHAIEQQRCLGISEGPKLTLKEHSRKEMASNGERKILINYTLEVTGTCPGESYDFYIVRQDGTRGRMGELRVNEEMGLFFLKDQHLLKDHFFNHAGFMLGEVISYVLVNKESNVISAFVYAPNPIEAKWEDGGFAAVTSLGPEMNCFCLRCIGFDPQEVIHYTSRCSGEMKEQEYPVESDGTLTIFLVFDESCGDGGINRITLGRTSGEIILKIPFGTYAKDEKYWK